jgi:hypothetical protein
MVICYSNLSSFQYNCDKTNFCRYFIEPEASENNNIPVVNIHLSEPSAVLPKSPLAGEIYIILKYSFVNYNKTKNDLHQN